MAAWRHSTHTQDKCINDVDMSQSDVLILVLLKAFDQESNGLTDEGDVLLECWQCVVHIPAWPGSCIVVHPSYSCMAEPLQALLIGALTGCGPVSLSLVDSCQPRDADHFESAISHVYFTSREGVRLLLDQDRNAEGGMEVSKQMLLPLWKVSKLVPLPWWDPGLNLHRSSKLCKGYKVMPGLSETRWTKRLLKSAWQGLGRVQLWVFAAARHRKP